MPAILLGLDECVIEQVSDNLHEKICFLGRDIDDFAGLVVSLFVGTDVSDFTNGVYCFTK